MIRATLGLGVVIALLLVALIVVQIEQTAQINDLKPTPCVWPCREPAESGGEYQNPFGE